MLCDICNEREAVISYTKIGSEETEVIHLCKECAEKKMKEDSKFKDVMAEKMASFTKQMFESKYPLEESDFEKTCPTCKTSLKDVIDGKSLGCEDCYKEFKEYINGFLLNLNSASIHKGKIPKVGGKEPIVKKEEIQILNKLSVAIALEEYEEAAKLRDELNSLREV